MFGDTQLFHIEDLNDELIRETIKEIYSILEEKGYNPINQLVGYIISGDPGYITSYSDARKKISSIERVKLIEVLLKDYVK